MAVNLVSNTTVTRARLYQGQPSTSNATLYTVPASTDVAVQSIVLCNTTSTAATVTLSVVPTGGTAGVANQVLAAQSVPSNGTTTVDTVIYMTAGDFLAGLQGTSGSVTVTVSGEVYA